MSTSSHFSLDRVNVSGSCGSGISSASQPCSANSALRPSAVARASSGSGWEVKNWNGLDEAHSSPMKSMAVYGDPSTSAALTAS